MKISLFVSDEKFVANKVAQFAERGGDMRPVFRSLVGDFYSTERLRFASEGDGDWAPLRPLTVEQRGSSHPILDESGALRASLTKARSKGSKSRVRAGGMFVGTTVFYGRFHQTGTEKVGATKARRKSRTKATGSEPKRMPARKPIRVTQTTRRRWLRKMQRYVTFGTGL
jgi:phage gpG-like protein